ncbi:DMT family transporter [Pararhodobacter oceanensis]|uniref:EamA family transporter n=1 Tax=Pararhodobacter oceanensis TaxID=2172121 RepID=A0A2T8HSY4_9RHOB|nr:DMT family transporter [Pararhodobacter oceanensis]PVH28564.1 EamA family transporter [Pararhodobacter oceanensis]
MNTLRGPMFMVLSMAGFAAEDALIKGLALRVPIGQIGLFLGFGGALVFGIMAYVQGYSLFDRKALRGAVFLRTFAELFAVIFMLLSISMAPLSVVTAVLQAMPLTVTLAAAVFLREPVGWRRWSAIVIGFAGVMMIVRPGASGFDPYVLLPLGAVVALTVRDLATRNVPATVASSQVSGWGFAAAIPGGVILLLLRGDPLIVPTALDWGLQALTLLAGILGYITLVLATRVGDIGLTMPFRYSRLVFGMLIGVIVFGERPDLLTLIGAFLIVAAGLYTLMREMRLRRSVTRA